MFQPSYQNEAFDEMLLYLKDTKQGQPVSYADFTNHICGLHNAEAYTFMKRLKEKDLITYNDFESSVPVQITRVGIDFITRTSFVKESQKLYDKEQLLLNQNVSVGTNYGQINAGHQSSFSNSDQTFSTKIPQTTPTNNIKSSLSEIQDEKGFSKAMKYIGDNIVKIIVSIIAGLIVIYLSIKFGLRKN